MAEAYPTMHEQQVANLHEAIHNANTVTVEFGTGEFPLFDLQGGMVFDERELYVGINIESRQHKFLAERLERLRMAYGFAVYSELQEDDLIANLPIPDESIDTVFMGNVLGEPKCEHIMQPFQQADKVYHGGTDIEAKLNTFQMAMCLLKPGGRIVILETLTPYRSPRLGNEYYALAASALDYSGFTVAEAYDGRSEGWEAAVARFAAPKVAWHRASYLVVAQKPAKSGKS